MALKILLMGSLIWFSCVGMAEISTPSHKKRPSTVSLQLEVRIADDGPQRFNISNFSINEEKIIPLTLGQSGESLPLKIKVSPFEASLWQVSLVLGKEDPIKAYAELLLRDGIYGLIERKTDPEQVDLGDLSLSHETLSPHFDYTLKILVESSEKKGSKKESSK